MRDGTSHMESGLPFLHPPLPFKQVATIVYHFYLPFNRVATIIYLL